MSVEAGSHYVDNQSPNQRDFDGVRWIDVFNIDTQDLPAGCLLWVNSYATGTDGSGAEPGTALVTAPTSNNQTGLLINGPTPISQKEYGQAHNDFPSSVLYEAGDGTPKIGDQWGSKIGDPKLRLGQTGYVFQGVSTTDQYGVVSPVAASASSGCVITFVSNVCGSVVEYTTMNLLTCQVLNIFCVTSPTGCCGTILPGCCTPAPPNVLCMSWAVTTSNAGADSGRHSGLSALLTWNGVSGWEGTYSYTYNGTLYTENYSLVCSSALSCITGLPTYVLSMQVLPDGNSGSVFNLNAATIVCSPAFTSTFTRVNDPANPLNCSIYPTLDDFDNDYYTITVSSDLSSCSVPPPVPVACCPSTLSSALTLSLSGVSHFATSYPMTWDPINLWYSTGTITVGGFANCEFRFACIGSTSNSWQLTQYCGGSLLLTRNSTSGACSPFDVTFFGAMSLAYGVACVSVDSATGAIVTAASGGGSGGGGTGPVITSCCPLGLPTTIHVTLANVSGSCGCLAGSYALTWLPNQNVWVGSANLCSDDVVIQFGCAGATQWYISIFAASVLFYGQTLSSGATCSPLNVPFANQTITSPCAGTINATVTA